MNHLSSECLSGLQSVDGILGASRSQIAPPREAMMLPFHLVAPTELKLLVVCKEPYGGGMATGIPVEVSASTLQRSDIWPRSAEVFQEFISEYWDGVNKSNFMRCYHASGILVINAAFTRVSVRDKRYALACSHRPLWSRFTSPLVKQLNEEGVPILGLGVEAKELLQPLRNRHIVHLEQFPRDRESVEAFTATMHKMFAMYILPATHSRTGVYSTDTSDVAQSSSNDEA